MSECFRVALIGNPNCGKTTLINALTGSKLRVGNWPGVTVERKSGCFRLGTTQIEVIDLPGTYSLTTLGETRGVDEHIACEFITHGDFDVVVNVIDAANLERNLYLTTQLLEMNVPVILALNMMDTVRAKRWQLDHEILTQALDCPVVLLESHKQKGIETLKQTLQTQCQQKQTSITRIPLPASVQQAIENLLPSVKTSFEDHPERAHSRALRLLEQDQLLWQQIKPALQEHILERRAILESEVGDLDICLADARYTEIHRLIQRTLNKQAQTTAGHTAAIDKIVLHRWLGIPIFLGVMYCLFLFSINIGGAFKDFFDITSDAIFVQSFSHVLLSIHCPSWLAAVLANGAGKGINTTVTFIPIIGAMFFFLAFLEASGYMARAAFVVDRLMRAIGLPGKSFVPLIVGFGCNVPAIMATRTLENKRDRILTTLMAPFMSCSARLAIFAVFTSAFFPVGGQNVVFALYLLGIVMAVFTGWMLRKTLLPGKQTAYVMEMPAYHWPTWRNLITQTWSRLKNFIFKAGKLIIPICMLIGALNTITWHGSDETLLASLGKTLTPLFAPMGLQQDNWPATVGLLTGTLAKEVVVATLNTLYTQAAHLTHAAAKGFDFWGQIKSAFASILENIRHLPQAFSNPILASVPEHEMEQSVYGLMSQRFDGQLGAFAYLLFVLLYVPCASTVAAMAKEVSRAWTIFSVLWSTALAYGSAVLFYQTATWLKHPTSSAVWVTSIILGFITALLLMRITRAENAKLHFAA